MFTSFSGDLLAVKATPSTEFVNIKCVKFSALLNRSTTSRLLCFGYESSVPVSWFYEYDSQCAYRNQPAKTGN